MSGHTHAWHDGFNFGRLKVEKCVYLCGSFYGCDLKKKIVLQKIFLVEVGLIKYVICLILFKLRIGNKITKKYIY